MLSIFVRRMSLLIDPNMPTDEKPKVFADRNEYQKEYRKKNNDKMKASDRTRYYKSKYNLTEDFTKKYGIMSGDVWKVYIETQEILKQYPHLKTHIIEMLQKID
jgi:hypothetical protein